MKKILISRKPYWASVLAVGIKLEFKDTPDPGGYYVGTNISRGAVGGMFYFTEKELFEHCIDDHSDFDNALEELLK